MKPQEEAKIKQFWEQNDIYRKAKAMHGNGKKFFFLDGPPYATGFIHLGTAWNKILKDVYIRFWRMRGFNVWDQPGYDTHGLPIEKKVEQLLKFRSKAEIEHYGVSKFNDQCKKFATEHISTMNQEFANLGVWMDWDNPYLTLANEYIVSAWHTFKVAFEKGFLYRGLYPVHVCPKCETAVAYNEIEYKKLTDPSIYVKFPVEGEENTFLLVWTTTPWTLFANTGIMAHPNEEYVKLRVGEDVLIFAKPRVDEVMHAVGKDYKIMEVFKGKRLEGLRYKNPLSGTIGFAGEIVKSDQCTDGAQSHSGYRVVMSEQFVSMEDGTGLVHTAPGHGKEDYKVGVDSGLPVVSHVKLNGCFDEKCGKYSGMNARESNRIIIEELTELGALFHEERIVHDYPTCWRCESALVVVSIPQWFFKVSDIRDKLLKENRGVKWVPDWAGQRFDNWLESLSDWPISRQRYWGIPLPIWVCEKCSKIKVIGSLEELKKEIDEAGVDVALPADLHRPYIDDINFQCMCGERMKRVQDVLDVWFDAGLCSWASLGYPKQKDLYKKFWPADLNIEGPDQIRGWWNSQLITSMITFDKAPFKTILFHGFVLDAHGNKMSKSKGNITTPEDVVSKYNRDILRFYMLSSAPWDNYYFNWRDVDALSKQFMIVENAFNFVNTYVPRIKNVELSIEDRWILSRLNSSIKSVTKHFENYHAHKACEEILNFVINDFSRTYIKLIRDRVWPAYGGDDAAFYTLYQVSDRISKLFSSLCPFLAEDIHQKILIRLGEQEESVHLCSWPCADEDMIHPEIEKNMVYAQKIIEIANSIRQENKIKLRWPLNSIVVEGKEMRDVVQMFGSVIKNMCNVKNVRFGIVSGDKEIEGIKVFVDTQITHELKKEAFVRELIRKIQELRKSMKLVVSDRVELFLDCDKAELSGFENDMKKEVGAKKVSFGKIGNVGKDKTIFEFEDRTIEIGIKKEK